MKRPSPESVGSTRRELVTGSAKLGAGPLAASRQDARARGIAGRLVQSPPFLPAANGTGSGSTNPRSNRRGGAAARQKSAWRV